jgi:hypothetical protein
MPTSYDDPTELQPCERDKPDNLDARECLPRFMTASDL